MRNDRDLDTIRPQLTALLDAHRRQRPALAALADRLVARRSRR
jgi:hypothetical protein